MISPTPHPLPIPQGTLSHITSFPSRRAPCLPASLPPPLPVQRSCASTVWPPPPLPVIITFCTSGAVLLFAWRSFSKIRVRDLNLPLRVMERSFDLGSWVHLQKEWLNWSLRGAFCRQCFQYKCFLERDSTAESKGYRGAESDEILKKCVTAVNTGNSNLCVRFHTGGVGAFAPKCNSFEMGLRWDRIIPYPTFTLMLPIVDSIQIDMWIC